MPNRRNPKLSPRERLLSQVETMPIPRKPRPIQLGDVITHNGRRYRIHDANDTGLVLESVDKIATLLSTGIVPISEYIEVPYSQLQN